MQRRTSLAALLAIVGIALAACATQDAISDRKPIASDTTTTVVAASGFGPLRAEDVRAFAQPLFGDAAALDDAERAQATAAANAAVMATDGAPVTWRSTRHTGSAEASGQRYEKYIWHCYDAARHTTYRDERPCRSSDRMVDEADYWRLSAGNIAPVVAIASVAPAPARQPCRTINEVIAFEGGRLIVMREHCVPLPRGP